MGGAKTFGRRAPFLSGAPAAESPSASRDATERVIALVDMNAFFAQVEQICNPSLRGKPILVGGNPTKRTIVTAASYEARPYGIKAGMSYHEALRRCPQALIVEGDTTKYLDYCYRIVAILREFTDAVEAFSIDEAFLDLTHVQRLFGTPEEICVRIKQRLREELDLLCSIGIGPNKLVAKMASDWQKPDGLTRVWQDELPHILRPLPVEELVGVGRHMQARLGALGITTIGQLADYDAAALERKFGVYGELLHRWANGIDDSPVDPGVFLTVKSMGHSYTLPYDTNDMDTIAWFIFWLADRVGRRLRRDGYHGRTVTLAVRGSDMGGFTRSRTLPQPVATGQALRDVAIDLFREHVPPSMKVRLLGVGLSNLQPDRFSQLSFFGDEARRRRAVDAMDRVKDRYGDAAITFATLTGNPQKLIRKKIGVFLTNKEKGRPDSPLNPPPDTGC